MCTLVLHIYLLSACVCTPLSFSAYSPLCLMHTAKPTGVAFSNCMIWFQTQLILTLCQIRYHSHLWGHCRIGKLLLLIPRSYLEYHTVNRLRQLILVWTTK